MNDPNKRIDVNISSLLSLKAELLRKQEEVTQIKEKNNAEPFVPKKKIGKSKNDYTDTNIQSSPKREYEEIENTELLNRSRRTLEAKAKFYDKMTRSGGVLNSDDNCLVRFQEKKQKEKGPNNNDKDSDSDDNISTDGDEQEHLEDPDDEWVEYTDCLGRTRKCLKKDLDFFKIKDSKLAENIQPRMELNQNAPMWMIDKGQFDSNLNNFDKETSCDASEINSIMSKHEQMKNNWEKKEEENIHKENVHYQDVFFDEARAHGVGYYAFSTEEEERAKQQRALEEIREKTLEAQKVNELRKEQREKAIAERVKAAKNRRRARLGLPPIDDDEKEEKSQQELYDKRKEEKRKRREEKARKKKEKEEIRLAEARKHYVRPWDKHKEGINPADINSNSSSSDSDEHDWKYKPEREPMSQEQWNEKQREMRNPEFGPMPENFSFPQNTNSNSTNLQRPPVRTNFRAEYSNFEQYNEMPPPASSSSSNPLRFTTKKPKSEFVRRNYIPIVEKNDEELNESKERRSVEIPPPPTFEYYGPNIKKQKRLTSSMNNLEDSIAAGLKFLRNQSDKSQHTTKSSWTTKADY